MLKVQNMYNLVYKHIKQETKTVIRAKVGDTGEFFRVVAQFQNKDTKVVGKGVSPASIVLEIFLHSGRVLDNLPSQCLANFRKFKLALNPVFESFQCTGTITTLFLHD